MTYFPLLMHFPTYLGHLKNRIRKIQVWYESKTKVHCLPQIHGIRGYGYLGQTIQQAHTVKPYQ